MSCCHSRKIICFLHDIVESFSNMINVAFVIFLNSPTASSIVPWQIFKLRFIDGDTRSTPSQTPVSVTDNVNPGAVGIPRIRRVRHATWTNLLTRLTIGSICREQRMKNDNTTHSSKCAATCRVQLMLNLSGDNTVLL